MYINMRNKDDFRYNYLSLFTGLFLKFYKNRKPLKRTKLFKMLVIRFLRKLLISATVQDVTIVFNKLPILVVELLRTFLRPGIDPFFKPNRRKLYYDDASNSQKPFFRVYGFLFQRTNLFTRVKGRKRGRLKRKIYKRLIKKNSVSD
jgi:hypothetical protein